MRKKRRPAAGDDGPKQKGKRSLSTEIAEPTQAHFLSVYDGSCLAGFIVERGGQFLAFDPGHELIGTYANQRDAMLGIPMVRS
jgi:hypothetical protein